MALYNQGNKVGIGTVDLSDNADYLKSKNLFDYNSLLRGQYGVNSGSYIPNEEALATPKMNTTPNTIYYFQGIGRVRVHFWNGGTYISNELMEGDGTFIVPSNANIFAIHGASESFAKETTQLTIGNTPTTYQAYVESNVELAEKVLQKELELAELKMLGWNVPKECPIQNEVSGNTFTQRVGRVDLGTLEWMKDDGTYWANIPNVLKNSANAYMAKYARYNSANWTDFVNNAPEKTYDKIYSTLYISVKDSTYADVTSLKNSMSGTYLYYELETPIIKQIDGNEVIEKDIVTAKVKNFVKPTSDAELLALSNGIYSINVDDTSLFPVRWGTLIVLKSAYVYGSMLFIGTDAKAYIRNINNGAWREASWTALN